MLGQTTGELQDTTAGGIIVIVNVAGPRSDATLITRLSIRALPLPGLQTSDAKGWLQRDWTVDRKLKRGERIRQVRWKNYEFL